MAECADSPGATQYGNEASGYTQRLERRVQSCGGRRNRNAVTGLGAGCCVQLAPVGLAAVQQSAYLEAKMKECTPFQGPAPAKTSQDYTLQLGRNVAACEASLLNPEDRFRQYYKFTPDLCPPIPAEQLNSTLPKPSFNGQCQPSRFF